MSTQTKRWTLAELHSLPDDGNTYELIHGELFVTPPPTDNHETIAARLTRILDRYVAANGLGYVYRPKAVMQVEGSQVEPDLMVRSLNTDPKGDWARAPKPLLVVEILSPSTRRRDQQQKRDFYMEVGVELWLVDPDARTITVVRRGVPDLVRRDRVEWRPVGSASPLTFEVDAAFSESS